MDGEQPPLSSNPVIDFPNAIAYCTARDTSKTVTGKLDSVAKRVLRWPWQVQGRLHARIYAIVAPSLPHPCHDAALLKPTLEESLIRVFGSCHTTHPRLRSLSRFSRH
jgi:hypothetical protein